MKQLLAVLVLALSVGCATTSEMDAPESNEVALASAETGKKKPKRICTRSRVTGTHLYTQICRTEEDIEAERDATQNALLRPGAPELR